MSCELSALGTGTDAPWPDESVICSHRIPMGRRLRGNEKSRDRGTKRE
jgi:hypothetical protein